MLTYSEINDLIIKGSEMLWKGESTIAACDLWLEAWEGIKQIMTKESLVDISEVDDIDFIENYVQDLEQELHNAGIDESIYFEKRIVFCEELIERTKDELIRNNTRRALADSYASLGKFKEAEEAFEQLVKDEPNWSWGYVGWSDYYVETIKPACYEKAAKILEKGLKQIALDSPGDLQDRCEMNFSAMDDREKITPYGAKLRRLAKEAVPVQLDQALKRIMRYEETFAEDEIWCVREHRDVAIPQLLELLKQATINHVNSEALSEDLDDHMYAMHLLAEFKEHKALPLFLEILELDEETCDQILGDQLTEGMGSLIGSISTVNDIERIKKIVENSQLDQHQRGAALDALIVMFVCGKYSRQALINYFEELLQSAIETIEISESDIGLISYLVSHIHKFAEKKLYPLAIELFELNRIEIFFIRREQLEDETPTLTDDEVRQKLKDHQPITDTIKTMSHWAKFKSKEPKIKMSTIETPTPSKPTQVRTPIVNTTKVGRNDPCPCGSGKKYKKCCL